MNVDALYKRLNTETSTDPRWLLMEYLRKRVKNLPSNEDEQRVAYEIAGLMSTKFALSLKEGDVIEQIFSLAGELEVPSENNAKKWQVLRELIIKADQESPPLDSDSRDF